ncbi:preprotein translocase subunit Sec61beta [Candidatus Woesearchaeota archaeon]|nr:preprotein translocase subunit Sec61beta [Candidatus Woesearchaeota archaeon]
MASQDRVNLPSGIGGLVRYFDDYKSKIEFQPGHIITLVVVVIIIEILLFTFGKSWFGIG